MLCTLALDGKEILCQLRAEVEVVSLQNVGSLYG